MIFLEKPQRGERNGAEARNWFYLYPPRWWQKTEDPRSRSSKKVRQNKMWSPLTLYHQGPSYHLESTVHHCDIKIILSGRHLSSWISFFLKSRVSPKYMKVPSPGAIREVWFLLLETEVSTPHGKDIVAKQQSILIPSILLMASLPFCKVICFLVSALLCLLFPY